MLSWPPILGLKGVKLVDSPSFVRLVALAFENGLEYYHSDLKRFIFDDMATLYVNLVNSGPVTLEFKSTKMYIPSSISSLAVQRHC